MRVSRAERERDREGMERNAAKALKMVGVLMEVSGQGYDKYIALSSSGDGCSNLRGDRDSEGCAGFERRGVRRSETK
jgi:hypothetical protein